MTIETHSKSTKKPDCVASIILPVKNAGSILRTTLEMIFQQEYDESFEVIVIDSGSTDGSLTVASEYPVSLIQIQPEEFGHGRTRNLGADLARGRFLVYLTADAVPASRHWLQKLTGNLKDNRVAGSFGRQIPHQHTSPLEGFLMRTLYPEQRMRIRESSDSKQRMSVDNILFSNVNSVVRKTIWQNNRFADDQILSEDQEWAKRVLRAGHVIVYDPEATVFHSHDYGLGRLFRRSFDSAYSLRGVTDDRVQDIIGHGLRYVARQTGFLASEGMWYMIPYALLYEVCRAAGLFFGRVGHLLPLPLRRRLSMHPEFWQVPHADRG